MENELYHYGVKGMKWGVRRKTKANNRPVDTDKSMEVEVVKKKHLSTKQKVAIGTIAATGILAAYGSYKLSNSRHFDRTIKIGKDFYRQGHKNESVEGLNELVYATFKKSDAKKYEKLSGVIGDNRYKIQSSRNVKIAGTKNAERIYKEVLQNNESFRSHYGNMTYKDFNGGLGFANKIIIEQNKLYNKTLKDTYTAPFFEALANKGYNAIVDTQDNFAKIPVILINSMKEYRIV